MTDEGKHLKESKELFTQSFSKNTKKPQDNKSATTTSTVTKDISKLSKMVRPWSDPIRPCSQPTEEELTHLLYVTKCDFCRNPRRLEHQERRSAVYYELR